MRNFSFAMIFFILTAQAHAEQQQGGPDPAMFLLFGAAGAVGSAVSQVGTSIAEANASVGVARSDSAATLGVSQANAAVTVHQSDNNTEVSMAQTAAAVAINRDNNQTKLQSVAIQAAAQIQSIASSFALESQKIAQQMWMRSVEFWQDQQIRLQEARIRDLTVQAQLRAAGFIGGIGTTNSADSLTTTQTGIAQAASSPLSTPTTPVSPVASVSILPPVSTARGFAVSRAAQLATRLLGKAAEPPVLLVGTPVALPAIASGSFRSVISSAPVAAITPGQKGESLIPHSSVREIASDDDVHNVGR